jgi:hypothetical protein
VIRRAVMVVLLVAVSGLLVFGAVHRTESVLAAEERGSGIVQTQTSESAGNGGHGKGAGLGSGDGQGLRGNGRGSY